jgi:Secretion system C-terminal sorting domain
MRKCLPFASFLLGTVLFTNDASAQQSERFAYAVTDMQQHGSNWAFLRKLDLQTGEYGQILLSGTDAGFLAHDASTKKQLTTPLTDQRYGTYINAPFATGVAAVAYDKRNNRLYYTPMLFDQLRYIDLKTMKVYYVTDRAFSGQSQKSTDQGNIVTRMVIASDGNGYAMTNDGMQLLQFTTGKKMQITDLGAVVDDQANKGVSIHNSCSSFGGDMIADDNGNLYAFSARNHVFKINIETKVATHLGVVTGLPAGFTINGAAVTDENKIIVSSAMQGGGLYTVDAKTFAASPYTVTGASWQTSDLANSNLLASGAKAKGGAPDLISNPVMAGSEKISIYPNPVTNNQFAVQFNELEPGNYTIIVTDVTGRQIVQQPISISGENQTQQIKLNATSGRGVYLVKVANQSGKAVYSTKVVVQ